MIALNGPLLIGSHFVDTRVLWVTTEAGAAPYRERPNGHADPCPGQGSQRAEAALVYEPVVT